MWAVQVWCGAAVRLTGEGALRVLRRLWSLVGPGRGLPGLPLPPGGPHPLQPYSPWGPGLLLHLFLATPNPTEGVPGCAACVCTRALGCHPHAGCCAP